jgi:hypothetical protein
MINSPMTSSLKAFIPKLAKALEMNPTALYERQRALIRGGLLETKAGHGPGSGVRLSPESVAMLLVSILATSSLVDVEAKTREVAELQGPEGVSFAQALTRALGSEDLAADVETVGYFDIHRAVINYKQAHHDFLPKEEEASERFEAKVVERGEKQTRLVTTLVRFQGELIQLLAKELANAR